MKFLLTTEMIYKAIASIKLNLVVELKNVTGFALRINISCSECRCITHVSKSRTFDTVSVGPYSI